MKLHFYLIFSMVLLVNLSYSDTDSLKVPMEASQDDTQDQSIKVDTTEVLAQDSSSTQIQQRAVDTLSTRKISARLDDDEEDDEEDLDEEDKGDPHDTIDGSLLVKKFSEIRTSFTTKLSKSRAQGYGGGIALGPMVIGLRMDPVNELSKSDDVLKKYNFTDLHDGYKALLVTSAMPYGGLGNGVRIGFGGWGGDIVFGSEEVNDTIMLLKVHTVFGGLMLEKAFVKRNVNTVLGGMVGMGSMEVTRSKSRDAWHRAEDSKEKAEASFAGLSFHTGFTVTLLPWMHAGIDGNGTVLFSLNGFEGSGNGGFCTVAPGLRLRIVLGNIG